ncbi:hypothetical protein T492DRAFT_878041 [Pavlovales sp. CCMP2436]|nr:hypothetical protein T492DRAFT_878041 [Pavlovales sp. CCMP2436]
MLIDAGVAAIFGPGTRVPLAARQVISQLTERLLEAQGEEMAATADGLASDGTTHVEF